MSRASLNGFLPIIVGAQPATGEKLVPFVAAVEANLVAQKAETDAEPRFHQMLLPMG